MALSKGVYNRGYKILRLRVIHTLPDLTIAMITITYSELWFVRWYESAIMSLGKRGLETHWCLSAQYVVLQYIVFKLSIF